MKTEITKVIFRKFPEGDVIAMFPEIASTVGNPGDCLSYQSIGQHGGADLLGLTHALPKASRSEYRNLATELRRIGYKLKVISRVQPGMLATRRAQLNN